jgi:hypothetical protein
MVIRHSHWPGLSHVPTPADKRGQFAVQGKSECYSQLGWGLLRTHKQQQCRTINLFKKKEYQEIKGAPDDRQRLRTCLPPSRAAHEAQIQGPEPKSQEVMSASKNYFVLPRKLRSQMETSRRERCEANPS